MKKTIVVILAIVLLLGLMITVSYSESIDLSTLSYEELSSLQERIIKEMISRPEYKEVIVPLGVYKVGEDIPAGKWTISGVDGSGIVYWGKAVDEYGVEIASGQLISDFTHWGDEGSIDWDLVEGTYIAVTISPVKFTPYIPKSLGF